MDLPQLSGYKIKQEFAAGGMAKIYDAVQVSLNRAVAIKFLSPQLLSHPEANQLFESESLIIAQLNHPNIVHIIDKGISDNSQPYFVMEKIKGIDLAKILSEGELPFSKKLDIAIQLCKGLSYAHKNGVIHRDIKPSNIIIDQHGDVKILDFGIALTADQETNNKQQTTVMGTQGYVAPEQQEDYSNATFVSDIYSVGVLLSELFSGSKDTLAESEELNSLIKKCCAKLPEDRYQSLFEVRDKLLQISQGSHLSQTKLKELQQENKDLASNFNLLDLLSKTSNKRVYLFQKKSNGQLLVIKRSFGDIRGLKQAKYLSSLKHPNIVNIYAAAKKNNDMTLVSEYLSGGSLSNQLIQEMSEQTFLVQACQICSALYFAHQNNILHCNLSPNNILFDDKQNLKLCDFGQVESSDNAMVDSRQYQPPANQGFCEEYDVYCMGGIFYHMLYGVPPGTPIPSSCQKASFRLQKLIDNMLSLNPKDRPSSAQVMVELQRIANADNKRPRSTMGQARDEEEFKAKTIKPKQKKIQVQSDNHTIWLSVSLLIAVACIVALLLKDFI